METIRESKGGKQSNFNNKHFKNTLKVRREKEENNV